jgi:cytochrome c
VILRSVALFAAITMSASAVATQSGDPARGARVFQRCYSCHTVDPNETARLSGPSLYRVLGRPAGSVAGFEYSEAMLERARSGLVWSAAGIDAFIADPRAFLPGTAMSLPPLRDPQERADVIAYLAKAGEGGR